MKVGHLLFPIMIICFLACILVLAEQHGDDWKLLKQHNDFLQEAQDLYFSQANRNRPTASRAVFSNEDGSIVVKQTTKELGILVFQYFYHNDLIAKDEWFNDRRKGRRTHYRLNGQVFAKVKFEGRASKVVTFVGASGDILSAQKDFFPLIPFVIYY